MNMGMRRRSPKLFNPREIKTLEVLTTPDAALISLIDIRFVVTINAHAQIQFQISTGPVFVGRWGKCNFFCEHDRIISSLILDNIITPVWITFEVFPGYVLNAQDKKVAFLLKEVQIQRALGTI